MRKYAIYGLLVLALILPIAVKAQSNTNVDEATTSLLQKIEQLKQQITQLQEELSKVEQQVQEIIKFTKTLRKGITDEEVKRLQEFLKRDPEVYPEGLVTGFFGSLTEKAVKKFQEKHAEDVLQPLGLSEGTGIVGVRTIETMNKVLDEAGKSGNVPPGLLRTQEETATTVTTTAPVSTTTVSEEKIVICHSPPGNLNNKQTLTIGKSAFDAHLAHGDTIGACQPTQIVSASVKVLSPNGGEIWELGKIYEIKWRQTQDAPVKIELQNRQLIEGYTPWYKTVLYGFAGRGGINIYNWTIPGHLNPHIGYEICVSGSSNADPAFADCSDSYFTISEKITIVTPPTQPATTTPPVATSTPPTTTPTPTPTPTPYCGDQSCNNNETCSSCPSDCGTCAPAPAPIPGDTTAPVITNIQASKTATTTSACFHFTWQTNEVSNSKVVYSTSPLNGQTGTTLTDNNYVTNHVISTCGLAYTTPYYFKVSSTDASGNTKTSDQQTQTTREPLPVPLKILSVTTADLTQTSIRITWALDQIGQTRIEYGLTAAYGNTAWGGYEQQWMTGDTAYITGLTPGTLYHYRIIAQSPLTGPTYSEDMTFTTLSLSVSLGQKIRITTASGESIFPDVVWNGSGYGVSWTDWRDGHADIYFAGLDSNGQKITSDIKVATGLNANSNIENKSSIAWTGSEYAIAWNDTSGGANQDGIYFIKVDSSGNIVGEKKTVSFGQYYDSLRELKMTWSGSGYGLVWRARPAAGNPRQAYMAVVDTSGNKIGSDISLSSGSFSEADFPAIASNGSGYGVVWEGIKSGTSAYEVYFASFNGNGNKLVDSVVVTQESKSGPYYFPQITWNSSNYAVVWRGVNFVKLNTNGSKVSSTLSINSSGVYPIVAWSSGSYIAGWDSTQGQNCYLAKVDSSGTQKSSAVSVSGTGGWINAAANSGKFGIVYQDTKDGNSGAEIYFVTAE